MQLIFAKNNEKLALLRQIKKINIYMEKLKTRSFKIVNSKKLQFN